MTVGVEIQNRNMAANQEDAREQYANPMELLADALGTQYPPPRPVAAWTLALSLVPVAGLVVVSLIWVSVFLLTLAGAFASIQLTRPYDRIAAAWSRALETTAETRDGPGTLARLTVQRMTRPSIHIGMRPIGYSPLERGAARLRFRWRCRTWKRHFRDLSRIALPGSPPEASAHLRADYPTHPRQRAANHHMLWTVWLRDRLHSPRWPLWLRRCAALTLGIESLPGNLASVVHNGLTAWAHAAIQQSQAIYSLRRWRAQRVLRSVAKGLIRARTARTDPAACVATLSAQLGLEYAEPKLSSRWARTEQDVHYVRYLDHDHE